MITVLLITNAFTLVLAAILLYEFLRYRRRLHRFTKQNKAFIIPPITLDKLHHCFVATSLGYSRECEVTVINKTKGLSGATSDAEAWILAVLSKHASFLFEFGTCTGKTTYLMARNAPPDARVITLTLAPEQKTAYRAENEDNLEAARFADRESEFVEFVYTGSDVAHKITQLFGDSKQFDETPYLGRCDLVFVDGSHACSYVKSDSEKAFRMLRPGGLLLWHDYEKGNIATGDVYKYLNELSKVRPLHHIEGTSLVVFKSSV